MQTLLILFSKSFSYFPYGTCLLSVSIIYFPLHGIYHPLCIPMPRSVTRQIYTVLGGLQMTKRHLTLTDTVFQQAYTCTSIGNTFQNYNSKPEASIFKLSISFFIRNYLRNPIWFIFHRLLICLNSAGLHALLHVNIFGQRNSIASTAENANTTCITRCGLQRSCKHVCLMHQHWHT